MSTIQMRPGSNAIEMQSQCSSTKTPILRLQSREFVQDLDFELQKAGEISSVMKGPRFSTATCCAQLEQLSLHV